MISASISQEALQLLEKQPNKSKAVDEAVIAYYGSQEQKKETLESKADFWIMAYNNIEETAQAYTSDEKLTALRASKLLQQLRVLGIPQTPFVIAGKNQDKMALTYSERQGQLIDYLKGVIEGKKQFLA